MQWRPSNSGPAPTSYGIPRPPAGGAAPPCAGRCGRDGGRGLSRHEVPGMALGGRPLDAGTGERLVVRAARGVPAGARVEVAPYKRDPGDFVLWKPSPPDLPGW